MISFTLLSSELVRGNHRSSTSICFNKIIWLGMILRNTLCSFILKPSYSMALKIMWRKQGQDKNVRNFYHKCLFNHQQVFLIFSRLPRLISTSPDSSSGLFPLKKQRKQLKGKWGTQSVIPSLQARWPAETQPRGQTETAQAAVFPIPSRSSTQSQSGPK